MMKDLMVFLPRCPRQQVLGFPKLQFPQLLTTQFITVILRAAINSQETWR